MYSTWKNVEFIPPTLLLFFRSQLTCFALPPTLQKRRRGATRHAETPESWIIELQLNYIFLHNFSPFIKLSANIHDLSANIHDLSANIHDLSANIHDLFANMAKIVCKCRIYREDSSNPGFLQAWAVNRHPFLPLDVDSTTVL